MSHRLEIPPVLAVIVLILAQQLLASPETPADLPLPRQKQMATKGKSRWEADEDDEDEAREITRRKAEKEAKKAAKARKEKERLLAAQAADAEEAPAAKRRKVETDGEAEENKNKKAPGQLKLLRFNAPEIRPCGHIDRYLKLNHIEEGSYGVVSRAKDTRTGEIVALKKLKLDRETDGFPITSLREIQTLMASKHPNVVNVREVVMGDTLKE
jgi:cell division cycle 2-like protein